MNFTIGRFAALTGVSTKALRYYDEIGLLRPAEVNARTRYRRYSADQLQQMAIILALKQMDVPLSEIQRTLRSDRSVAERKRFLVQAKMALEQSLSEKARSLAWVTAELKRLGEEGWPIPVMLKTGHELYIVSLRSRLKTYGDLEAFEKELGARVPNSSRGAAHGVLWHRCADSGAVEGEPFIAVTPGFKATGSLCVQHLPVVTVACAFAPDNEAAAEAAFSELKRWVDLSGYQLSGPKREIYHPNLVEIQFPIQRDVFRKPGKLAASPGKEIQSP